MSADRGDSAGQGYEINGQLPKRLREELALLNPHESAVTSAAAVLGDQFDLHVLATVAQLNHDQTAIAVDGLRRRNLVRSVGQTPNLTFRDPLIGRLIYENLDLHWRAHAHRRAVGVLSRVGARATELAWHVERCTAEADLDDVPVLVQAAQDAVPSDPASAIRWIRTALRRLPDSGPPDDQRAELLIALTRALAVSDELPPGRRLTREILTVARSASFDVRAETVAFCGLFEAAFGHHVEARAILRGELKVMLARYPPGAATLMLNLGMVEFLTGNLPDSEDISVSLRLARKHDLTAAQAGALALRGLRQTWRGDASRANYTLTESASMLDALPDTTVATHPEYFAALGWAESFTARFADAERHLAHGISIARRYGHNHLLPSLLNGLCYTYQQLGRFAEARGILALGYEIPRQVNAGAQRTLTLALEWRNTILTEHEDISHEPGLAIQAVSILACRGSYWARIAALCLSDAASVSGNLELSATLLLGAGGGPELADMPSALRPSVLAALTAASVNAGVPAGELVDRAASQATLPHQRAHVLLARAHVARSQGEHATAANLYRDAAGLLAAAGMTCAQARALLRAASCAVAANHPDAAALLTEAKRLAWQCAATRIYTQADLQLRRLAPAAAARSTPAKERLAVLTDREREVAEITSTGKRTREIAEQLGLSPRTVDVHLTRIYRKLNVSSRAALASLIAENR